MQDDALKCPAEDDMTDGDLGDGNRGRPGHQARSRSQGDLEELSLATRFQKRRSDGCGESFSWTRYGQDTRGKHPCASCDGSDVECHSDHTSEELQRRLQEATLEVEVLRTELEVTHRHLEGKHEAVRILQGHAILEKATNHSKLLLQKTEERNKALEKEVNGLQWEINFNQVQFKNVEQAWVEKYERVCSENRALSKSLDEKSKEVQALRTENSSLSQQCVELLALLSAKERSAFQGTLPPANKGREGSVLELAVLGACQCSSGQNDPCPCAQSAAGSRKQVLQLKQELDAQRRKKEEAFVMADAFRIAFEQQLRRGSEHVLRMAETDRHKPSKQRQGQCRQGSLSLAQRLKGILPSTLEDE
ncbi:coiled-coil domain-containing protein 125 isoform X2 [Denticeps clupeoides]|uniref:coiled-coil domain-containing protein 125 isoform X2 n=1 Tax=Denticeps clupeoides TaxID=299321 RepID=UPI0010A2CD56|nr:coiled-coil domain-containing protein 125 isoform X2 [Denticeps clupeoides]